MMHSVGPLDAASITKQASQHGGLYLAVCLPLVVSYLTFVPQDSLASLAVQQSGLLQMLHALRARPELRPAHSSFGLASLCLR